MNTLEYRYRPKPWIMLAATAFFAAAGALVTMEALTNERGLIVQRFIHLSPQGATIFYWCVAALCALFVLAGLASFMVGLASKRYLRLTSTEISAPKFGWSRSNTVVRLAAITQIAVQTIQKQRILNIYHRGGKLSIVQSFLPNAAAFEEVHKALVSRARAVG